MGGEWTVTYETFRDMGIAFAIALVLIYMLVVWEFGNFVLPAIVMAPIPLTLIGIIPGHWILGAEFTATSMIGFIALAGIIVRNSILLVDFARHAVGAGQDVMEAMINACQARTRPILITAFALLAGSSVILFDPIFQGMAISLMFGTIVATLLTLLVIPLGAISARKILEADAAGGHGPDSGNGNGEHWRRWVPGNRPRRGRGQEKAKRRTMTDPSGGPVLKMLGFLWLYLKSLAQSFIEGVMQSLRAIARLLLRLASSGSSGGPPGPGTGGGSGPGPGPEGAPPSSGGGGPGPSTGDVTAPKDQQEATRAPDADQPVRREEGTVAIPPVESSASHVAAPAETRPAQPLGQSARQSRLCVAARGLQAPALRHPKRRGRRM
jgi:hypothetical protein